MCTTRASECAHLGRPNVHNPGVRMCIRRASECAHVGRPDVHNSGVQMCTSPPRNVCATSFARRRPPPETQPFLYITASVPRHRGRASECAQFGRPSVHTLGVRMCTIRASEFAQARRATSAQHHLRDADRHKETSPFLYITTSVPRHRARSSKALVLPVL